MKNILFVLFAFASLSVYGQVYTGPSESDIKKFNVTQNPNVPFRLFPMSNNWNFIKLDTRTGQLWGVQYSIKDDDGTFEYRIDTTPIEEATDENIGRFTLYPTDNMYNFILLDQINGHVWQVQNPIGKGEKFRLRIY